MICRTCLKVCSRSYKLYDMIGYYRRDGDKTKFSEVLKFIAPEMYLGVSRKPDICYTCVDALVNAYIFRKTCLRSEKLINKYLQQARCTAESIDLLDVLTVVGPKNAKLPPNVIREHKKQIQDKIAANLQPETQQKEKEADEEKMFRIDSVYSVYEKTYERQKRTVTTPVTTPVTIKQEKLSPIPETLVTCKPSPHSPTILPKPAPVKVEQEEITIKEELLDPGSDTSETLSATNMQGIIDSIDQSCDNAEYDIPEFVQINKIELKQMQPTDNNFQSKIVPLKIATSIGEMLQNSNLSFTGPNQLPRNILLQSFGNGLPPLVPLAATTLQNENSLPQVQPYPGGFYFATNFAPTPPVVSTQAAPSPVPVTSTKPAESAPEMTPNVQPFSEKRKRGRVRNRVKIVPVAEVAMKVEPETVSPPYSGYSPDGCYINDHDYLITPYKKNKASAARDKQMQCFICGNKHAESRHVMHMKKHSSICDVCHEDLGTPFMLNLHYKTHSKPCKLCTEKVPYWDIEKHEQKHLEEDEKFVESDVEKTQFGCHRGRKRQTDDEKPVYFPLKLDNITKFKIKSIPLEDNSLVIRKRGRKKISELSEETTPIPLPLRKSPRISKTTRLEESGDAAQSDDGVDT